MCTVSIVPIGDGFRLMCNRDERVARPVADLPRRVTVAGVDAVFPVDPQSGGTWIGVNDAGLAMALLNRTPSECRPTIGLGGRSRGEIVPRLLAARDLPRLVELVGAVDATLYEPFRIVALCRGDVLIATADGARLDLDLRRLIRPVAFTSSSLGDVIAERLRLPLFDALVAHAKDPLLPQRIFHGHQWTDCPAFSVRMRRTDARTVSRSIVNVGCADFADHRGPRRTSCTQLGVAARTFMVREGAATPRQAISLEYEPLPAYS